MNFKSIATVLLTTGITGAVTLGTTLAPAQAALLKFNFTTSGPSTIVTNFPLPDGSGSFFLDTSVIDQDSDPNFGDLPNAIKDLTFTGGAGGVSLAISNLRTNTSGGSTTFTLDPFFSFLGFEDPAGNLINQLSSNPLDYQSRFRGGQFQSQNITGLTVTDATAIPTPSLAFGLLATGFLALKRKMQKQEHSSAEV